MTSLLLRLILPSASGDVADIPPLLHLLYSAAISDSAFVSCLYDRMSRSDLEFFEAWVWHTEVEAEVADLLEDMGHRVGHLGIIVAVESSNE